MLVPPQPSFLGRNGPGSRFTLKNASMTSLVTNSNGQETYGSWSQKKRNSYSESSQGRGSSVDADSKARETFFNSQRRGSWMGSTDGASSDADSQAHSAARNNSSPTEAGATRRSRSKGPNGGGGLTVAAGLGGGSSFKGLGRKLFKRNSSANLSTPGNVSSSRSNSASSSSTAPNSPPLTPTTPPVLPLWLPNGKKDFFGDSPNLPPISIGATGKPLQSLDVMVGELGSKSSSDIDPQSPSSLSRSLVSSPVGSNARLYSDSLAASSYSLASTLDRSPSSNLLALPGLPTLPEAATPPQESIDGGSKDCGGMPIVPEESIDDDSDFLRAVLNFGDGDDDHTALASGRGGRAAALPQRSSSLFAGTDFSGSTFSSPSLASFNYTGGYSSGSSASTSSLIQRRNGRLVMTEAAAKELSAGPSHRTRTLRPLHVRPGLFRRDSDDSEDNYGEDEKESGPTSPVSPISPARASPPPGASSFKQTLSYFSSLAKNKSKPPSPSEAAKPPADADEEQDDEKEYVVLRPGPPGLDTPSKRSLYTCTLLKVHPYLANTLVPSLAEPQGALAKASAELRFPRSINGESALRLHASTLGVSRSLRAAVGRTLVMRKLKKFSLPIEQEVEISWFQRKYSTENVSPETIRTALAKRQIVNPEALARPPIMAPNSSTDSSVGDIAASRRLSGIANLSPGQKLNTATDPDHNGMIVWARRPGFLERCSVIYTEEVCLPGDVVVPAKAMELSVGTVLPVVRKVQANPQPISFSPRVRLLAGLPSIEEERRLKTPIPAKFRRREAKRISRLFASEPGPSSRVGEAAMDGARPACEGRPREAVKKALPPWVAPRQPQLTASRASDSRSPSSTRQSPNESMTSSVLSNTTLRTAARRSASSQESSSAAKALREAGGEDEDASTDSDTSSEEDVPLGQLRDFRAHRAVETERIRKLEEEIAHLKLRDQIREREEQERRDLEEKARRLEEERMLELQRAREQALLQERAKKIVAEARERRANTRQSTLLSAPNYGAGNPRLTKQLSNPNLADAGASANAGARARLPHASPSLAQLSPLGVEAVLRPDPGFYAHPEHAGSRASMMPPPRGSMVSLAAPAPVAGGSGAMRASLAPMPTSPHAAMRPSDTMGSLSPPRSPNVAVSRTAPMAAAAIAPPARRASMMPPSPGMHIYGGGAAPIHSMSMMNLQAQSYLQHAQQLQHYGAPQTVRVSSRPGRGSMMPAPPLVSLYGNTIPHSASQRSPGWM